MTFIIISALLLTSCSNLPQFYQSAEDVLTDNAINITVSREALQKKTNLVITIEAQNTYDDSK